MPYAIDSIMTPEWSEMMYWSFRTTDGSSLFASWLPWILSRQSAAEYRSCDRSSCHYSHTLLTAYWHQNSQKCYLAPSVVHFFQYFPTVERLNGLETTLPPLTVYCVTFSGVLDCITPAFLLRCTVFLWISFAVQICTSSCRTNHEFGHYLALYVWYTNACALQNKKPKTNYCAQISKLRWSSSKTLASNDLTCTSKYTKINCSMVSDT
jgi:hypothetical protein